ncbi:MAG: hypothetical protein ACI8W0_002023 [Flavobacterium sp.]|jgi:hypothetical protein
MTTVDLFPLVSVSITLVPLNDAVKVPPCTVVILNSPLLALIASTTSAALNSPATT